MTGAGFDSAVLRGVALERGLVRVGRGSGPHSPEPRESERPSGDALAQIEEAAARSRADGWAAGHEEGLRQGLLEAAARSEAALAKAAEEAQAAVDNDRRRLGELQVSLQAAVAGCMGAAEEDLLALCYEAVCRIVGECAVRPETVRAQLSALVIRHGGDGIVEAHVHPRDAEWLNAAGGDTGAAPKAVRWLADPEVALGGCIVRHGRGAIDARLETLLAACKEHLLAVRAGRAASGADS